MAGSFHHAGRGSTKMSAESEVATPASPPSSLGRRGLNPALTVRREPFSINYYGTSRDDSFEPAGCGREVLELARGGSRAAIRRLAPQGMRLWTRCAPPCRRRSPARVRQSSMLWPSRMTRRAASSLRFDRSWGDNAITRVSFISDSRGRVRPAGRRVPQRRSTDANERKGSTVRVSLTGGFVGRPFCFARYD
jgi:hypothetical protein